MGEIRMKRMPVYPRMYAMYLLLAFIFGIFAAFYLSTISEAESSGLWFGLGIAHAIPSLIFASIGIKRFLIEVRRK